MGNAADGSDRRRENRRPADPEQRRPRSLGRIAAIAGGIVLVVLVVWLVIYFAAREQSTEGSGAFGPVSEPGTGTVVSDSTVIARISR